MKLFDQHVHTSYSYDSKEPLENYISVVESKGIEYFVTTEHLDLNIQEDGVDWIPDFKKELEELNRLQKEHPNITFLFGVEFGFKRQYLDRLLEIKNSYNFDLINLSVHDYKDVDFYYPDGYEKYGARKCLQDYFDCCLDAVNTIKDYDVFCHFDFAYKTALRVDKSIKISEYEKIIKKIFSVVIKDGKTLEVNTKVQETLNDVDHIKYFLNLYKSLGGTDISLSSDAHKTDRYMSSFDKIIPIIKECGFNELCCFVHRKKYKCKI